MDSKIRKFGIASILAVSALAVIPSIDAVAETVLPKVEILGKEYFCYEVKKGDSIYGIAKQFNWDLNELVRLNPNTVNKLEKGAHLYYPTGKVVVVKEEEATDLSELPFEPITHVVKKGETVYSIAHLYNIPLETIYASHPSAKYGIKIGETIRINQSGSSVGNGHNYLYYNVKPGDTIYALAQKYKTTVADILKANPGVSESNFKAGSTIRLAVNSGRGKVRTELVDETAMASVDNYKVGKNETWSDISRRTGVPEETLREANKDEQPKKDEVVAVPVMTTRKVEREYTEHDPRESTPEGREELYDSIHRLDSDAREVRAVNIALLMDDPTSKRDQEFSRGFLLAIDELKNSPYKINFKVLDGRASTDNIVTQLEDFEPQLLISTADRNFPAFLADFGNENHVEVVNVFDVKNELYQDNPSMIQMLPPSGYFNDAISDYVKTNFGDRTIIFVGDADEGDAIAEETRRVIDGSTVLEFSVSELSDFSFADGDSYLIYAYPQKRDEVTAIVNAVSSSKEKYPLSTISLMGRPSWITLTENMADKFGEADVFIPSRFYYDQDSRKAKSFTSDFTAMFGHAPLKSFPMFAVTGYDVAQCFIPTVAQNGGDPNKGMPRFRSMQTDLDLKRVSNWSGFLNTICYVLHYTPGGIMDKIELK